MSAKRANEPTTYGMMQQEKTTFREMTPVTAVYRVWCSL